MVKMKKRSISILVVFLAVCMSFVSILTFTNKTTIAEASYYPNREHLLTGKKFVDEINLNKKLAEFNEKTKYDKMYKKKADNVKNALAATEATYKMLDSIIKDAQNGGDFDTAACIDSIVGSICAIANCFGPYGQIASSVLGFAQGVFKKIMGGKEPASELSLLEAHLDEKFDEIQREISNTSEQITELSNQLNEESNRIIDELSQKIDSTIAIEHVREFLGRQSGNFSFNEFREYLYGVNENGYANLLDKATSSNYSNEELKYYYDQLYVALKTNTDILYDYIMPEQGMGNSIIRDCYNALCADKEIAVVDAQYQTIVFAYNVYDTVLEAESRLIACNFYQGSYMKKEWINSGKGDFDEESIAPLYQYSLSGFTSPYQVNALNEKIKTRLGKLGDYIIKDLAYITGMGEYYVVKTEKGEFYEVDNNDPSTFLNVDAKQTIYLPSFPDNMYDIFSGYFNRGEITYIVDGKPTNGIFEIDEDICNRDVNATIKYNDNAIAEFNFYNNEKAFYGGSGTNDDPYIIANKNQFLRIGEGLDKHYRLIKDIPFTVGESIYSFGDKLSSNGDDFTEFTGSLDGNGNKIENLTIKSSGECSGLFAIIGQDGIVENLALESCSIKTDINSLHKESNKFYCGLIAGKNFGYVTNCRIYKKAAVVSPNIDSENVNSDSESDSENVKFTLKAEKSKSYIWIYAGGITGYNYNIVSSCSIGGKISIDSTYDFAGNPTDYNRHYAYAGGVCGGNSGYVECILADANVSSVATSKLSPTTRVNPYIESYGGIFFGDNDGEVSDLAKTETATAKGEGKISVYDSRYGEHYGNRKQSGSGRLTGTKENAGYTCSSIEKIESKLSTLNIETYNFTYEYEQGKDISYKVTENYFHTDGLNIYANDKKVDSYSIVHAYGWNPYNESFSIDNQKAIVVFLAEINGTSVLGQIVEVPVVIDANTVEYTVSNYDNSVQQGTEYSFVGMIIESDYAAGKDTSDEITEENKNKISVSGKFISASGETVNDITEIDGSELGKYILNVLFDGKLVAENIEISVVCEYTPANNPDEFIFDEENSKDSTCKEVGLKVYICKTCGEVITVYIPKKSEHSFVLDTSNADYLEATCQLSGRNVFTCEYCNYIKIENAPKLNHEFDGHYTEDIHKCATCGLEEFHQYHITEAVEDGNLIYYLRCDCGYEDRRPDNNVITDEQRTSPYIVVSDAYALHGGDTVKVYIRFYNNPGVDGAVFGVRYSEGLTFVEWTNGDVFNNRPQVYNYVVKTEKVDGKDTFIEVPINGLYFNWPWAGTSNTDNVLLIALTFKLPDTIPDENLKDGFKIEVVYGDIIGGGYGTTLCGFEKDGEYWKYLSEDGHIRIVDRLPGDVNNDGFVDAFDAAIMSRFIIRRDDTVDPRYGDVDANGDGVQGTDLSKLLKYLRGEENLIATQYDVLLDKGIQHEVLRDKDGNILTIPDRISVSVYKTDEEGKVMIKDNKFVTNTFGTYLEYLNVQDYGYTFDAWYDRMFGGNEVTASQEVKYNNDQRIQKLYAQWNINTVVFSYDGKEETIIYNPSGANVPSVTENYKNIIIKDGEVENLDYNLVIVRALRYWKDKNGNKLYAGDKIDFTTGNTYTAVWTYSLYNYKVDGTKELIKFLYVVPTKTGYVLNYIYEDAAFTTITNDNRIADYFNSEDEVSFYCEFVPALEYTAVTSGNEIISYTVSGIGSYAGSNLIIPSSYKGKPITYIGNNAFRNCSSLTSIVLPSSVTSIGVNAFNNCKSLTSVVLPSSVTSIGEGAFFYCSSLTSVVLPSSVTSIGDFAFAVCSSLTSLTFEEGSRLTSIGDDAFYQCSKLTSIVLPSSVTSIGSYAFHNCGSLTSVTFKEGSKLTSIGNYAFYNCRSLTSIEIPFSVTSIGDYAFSDCSSLTSIEVEEGNTNYKSIDGNLYSADGKTLIQYAIGKKDTSFTIPSSVTSIGNYAFGGCTGLTYIEIPSSVTSIGLYAFYGCSSLTSVTFEEGSKLTTIGGWAFYLCKLTSIEIPSSVTSIGYEAFSDCSSLTSIVLPSSVTSIGDYAFRNCSSLTSIEVEEGNTNGNLYSYDGKTLIQYAIGKKDTSFTIPSSVTSIGNYAFYFCDSLKSVTFGKGSKLTSIGYDAFYYCTSLTSIVLPSSVTSIGYGAFEYCRSLTSVTFEEGSKLTSISNSAFEYCSSLTSIEIPSSVTSIGERAFEYCSSLTSIEIPSSITSIDYWTFAWCSSLTSINFKGTMAKWKAISKQPGWNSVMPDNYKVYCTDGTLDKNNNKVA